MVVALVALVTATTSGASASLLSLITGNEINNWAFTNLSALATPLAMRSFELRCVLAHEAIHPPLRLRKWAQSL